MKTNKSLIVTNYQLDYHLKRKMEAGNSRLLEKARKDGRYHGQKNQPTPKGDNLNNYTGELITGYEKLTSEILQELQPATNIPEAKIDADYYKAKDAGLTKEIDDKTQLNQNDEYVLENFDPGVIRKRIQVALIITGVILLGEVLFNTKALQVTGESMLFAFLIALCISFSVYLLSHVTPLLYKWVRHNWQRRLVIFGSFLLATGLFTALAIFRSTYLEAHEIHIKPIYFVVINLFFFIVSTVVSFFVLPTWEEIKEHMDKNKIYKALQKRKAEIKQLKDQREAIKDEVLDNTKNRLRILYLCQYVVNTIEMMRNETVAVFKSTNLIFRGDGKSPDCFNAPLAEMKVKEESFNFLNPESK